MINVYEQTKWYDGGRRVILGVTFIAAFSVIHVTVSFSARLTVSGARLRTRCLGAYGHLFAWFHTGKSEILPLPSTQKALDTQGFRGPFRLRLKPATQLAGMVVTENRDRRPVPRIAFPVLSGRFSEIDSRSHGRALQAIRRVGAIVGLCDRCFWIARDFSFGTFCAYRSDKVDTVASR